MCSHVKDDVELSDASWPLVLQSFIEIAEREGTSERWAGVLLFAVGDLEWACNTLGLPHYNGVECCFMCKANCSDRPFNDYSDGKAWCHELRTEAEFQAGLRAPLHPLVQSSFFSRYTYRLDLLHLLDHHGIASHILANIIHMHVCSADNDIAPGSNQEERLAFY